MDSKGTFGPPIIVQQEESGLTEWHNDRWYCLSHSRKLWTWHLDPVRRAALARRRERLERWKRGEMEWQK